MQHGDVHAGFLNEEGLKFDDFLRARTALLIAVCNHGLQTMRNLFDNSLVEQLLIGVDDGRGFVHFAKPEKFIAYRI